MEFMLLFTDGKGAVPEPAGFEAMGKFAAELARQGILKRGFPLASESAAACVRVREAGAVVSDGPFAETKEVIGGAWVLDVPSREAALEIAARIPHARHASVEVHRLPFRGAFGDSERGAPYLLVFRMEPDDCASSVADARGREMRAFGEELVRAGVMFETGRLADREPSARIQVRRGQTLVSDGPFAESKELIGGYALVRVADRDQAIALAGRFPHARWGPVEVREILFLDRV